MFNHRHEAFQCLAEGLKEGAFKNCVHLIVEGGWEDEGLRRGAYSPYHPDCKERMLMPYNQNQFQNHCPQDCPLFQDKEAIEKEQKAAQRRIARNENLKTIVSPFIWFGKLPPTTQRLIILVLLVLLSPRLAKSVGEVVKLFKVNP